MRRLARPIFRLFSAVSLLLCVAVCVLWVRSYRFGDFGEFLGQMDAGTSGPTLSVRWAGIYSSHGCVGIGSMTQSTPANLPTYPSYVDGRSFVCSSTYCFERYPFISVPGTSGTSWWNDQGFCARSRAWAIYGPGTVRSSGATVPHWLLAIATALLPVSLIAQRWRSIYRRQRGHCTVCGYDLRASPDRCSECGTTPAAK